MNHKLKNEIRRTVAGVLIVCMLPFSSFAGIGAQNVYGAEITPEMVQLAGADADSSDGLSGNETGFYHGQNPVQEDLPILEMTEDKVLEEDWNVEEEASNAKIRQKHIFIKS